MKPEFGFTEKHFNTQYAPLCVVGHHLRAHDTLDPLLGLAKVKQKNRTHTPGEKLLDAFLLILAGYPSLYLLNQHLRPDHCLAAAWRRGQLAEQSTVSRTLDAFDEAALRELRTISWHFWQQHTRLRMHDWRTPILLDLDLSPLPAAARAEASTTGYLGEKTKRAVN
ncbi:MAG: transposase [Reinekea sp.]|nr:transposase [Reinekea sp.]